MENGECAICSDTCVGRIRYQGLVLYDADKIKQVAMSDNPYKSQLDMILDPHDSEVIKAARQAGISDVWLDAARRSPVYKMAKEWRIAFPLHPEYRTLPMAWYVPPLSAIKSNIDMSGQIEQNISNMRLPIKYLANLLTAGDTAPIEMALSSLLLLRQYKRASELGQKLPVHNKADIEAMEDMYRLLAIAKYDERFVIPSTDIKFHEHIETEQGSAGFMRQKG
jgi:nitrate reductase beta subunit